MKERPDVIVLPELWTTGYDLTRLSEIADRDGLETKEKLIEWSKQYGVHIVGGSIKANGTRCYKYNVCCNE